MVRPRKRDDEDVTNFESLGRLKTGLIHLNLGRKETTDGHGEDEKKNHRIQVDTSTQCSILFTLHAHVLVLRIKCLARASGSCGRGKKVSSNHDVSGYIHRVP